MISKSVNQRSTYRSICFFVCFFGFGGFESVSVILVLFLILWSQICACDSLISLGFVLVVRCLCDCGVLLSMEVLHHARCLPKLPQKLKSCVSKVFEARCVKDGMAYLYPRYTMLPAVICKVEAGPMR